jgi:hypothetical protein
MNEQNETPPLLTEAGRSQPGLLREMLAFMRHNKKWWLAPVIISVLLLGVLVVLSATGVAPFIYSLF